MKQSSLAAEQFGATAQAYLTSSVHAQGADLARLAALASQHASRNGALRALDLGCGAGHTAFAIASTQTAQVVACDLSPEMLAVVETEAKRRNLVNLETRCSRAEALPFADGEFDLVATRFSAHHWEDVPAALSEMRRVLKRAGTLVVIDVVAPEAPQLDSILQSAEILRDPSHVRDYRVSEWATMVRSAGFEPPPLRDGDTWPLHMEFDNWVARMRTSQVRAAAIRDLLARAPEEAQRHFNVQPDGSFTIDVAWMQTSTAP